MPLKKMIDADNICADQLFQRHLRPPQATKIPQSRGRSPRGLCGTCGS